MSRATKLAKPLKSVKSNLQKRDLSENKSQTLTQNQYGDGDRISGDIGVMLSENIHSPDLLKIKDLTDITKLKSLIPGIIENKMRVVVRAVSSGEYATKEFQEATTFFPMMYASWKGLPARQELKKVCAECLVHYDCCGKFLAAIKAIQSTPESRDERRDYRPEYWQSYRSMWGICRNVTDSSEVFAEKLCCTEGFLQLIWITLSTYKDEHLRQTQTEQGEKMNKWCLGIIYNCCLYDSTREIIIQRDFIPVLYPYLLSFKDWFRSTALLSMAYLVDEKQSARFLADSTQIKFLVSLLEGATHSTERRCKGWTLEGLLKGVGRIAINDYNKKNLVKEGILSVLMKLAESPVLWEKRGSTEVIWLLAYDDSNKERIAEEPGMIDLLQRLSESPDDAVKRHAIGALWVLRKMLSVLRKTAKFEKSSSKAREHDAREHVMISYHWADQSILIQVKEKLTSRGYNVWMDIENMHGSTLQAMAEAVECSCVVLVCLSQNYKNSPNCRAEAEYAYQLRKSIVPLKTKTDYNPDGWLGILVGTKLYFDFSGQYKFDSKLEELVRELSSMKQPEKHSESRGKNKPVEESPYFTTKTTSARKILLDNHQIRSEKARSLTEKELQFLIGLRKEAPEFFYHCLETRLGIFEIDDIFNFTKFLEEL